jgi:hypothetical protein
MNRITDESRRRLLKHVALGIVLAPLAGAPFAAPTAEAPLVSPDDPTARAVKYVGEAGKSPDARPGTRCGSCTLYQGAAGSAQGGCPLFPGKSVKATGWCSSWTAKS